MKRTPLLRIIGLKVTAAVPLLALVFGLATALASAPLSAEGDLRIKNAHVSVEPEYDEPRVLVIEQGTFAGNSFPAQVSFNLPAGAEPTEVCGLGQPGDEHLCQLYETRLDGSTVVLTYKLPVPDYYFEYYYNPVQGAGDRQVAFSYQPYYPIDSLQVAVQQPLRSNGFTLSPTTSQSSTDSQGFKYYQYSFNNLESQKPVDLKIAYQKSDDRPSVPKKNPSSTSGGNPDDKTGLVAMGIGGAGVLGFLGYMVVRRRPEAAQVSPRRTGFATAPAAPRRPDASATPASRPSQSRAKGRVAAPAFCSKCGVALDGDETFCSGCGQRVKRPGRGG
ncbi:MAG: zinc ribbon domain-containing protein [Dehalococcoidia bacterium]|nr:zinc ribbon domain-containing protein [Dehalococcoidia bacterium]